VRPLEHLLEVGVVGLEAVLRADRPGPVGHRVARRLEDDVAHLLHAVQAAALRGRDRPGPENAELHAAYTSTIASASISTSRSGEISRETSTIEVAGRIWPKYWPWTRPICSQ